MGGGAGATTRPWARGAARGRPRLPWARPRRGHFFRTRGTHLAGTRCAHGPDSPRTGCPLSPLLRVPATFPFFRPTSLTAASCRRDLLCVLLGLFRCGCGAGLVSPRRSPRQFPVLHGPARPGPADEKSMDDPGGRPGGPDGQPATCHAARSTHCPAPPPDSNSMHGKNHGPTRPPPGCLGGCLGVPRRAAPCRPCRTDRGQGWPGLALGAPAPLL